MALAMETNLSGSRFMLEPIVERLSMDEISFASERSLSVLSTFQPVSSSAILAASESRGRLSLEPNLETSFKRSEQMSNTEALKAELESIDERIHLMRLDRSRLEIEAEVHLEHEKNRAAKLAQSLARYQVIFNERKLRLEKMREKEEDVREKKTFIEDEINRLTHLNGILVTDTQQLDEQTKRLGITIDEYSKKLATEPIGSEEPRTKSLSVSTGGEGGIEGFQRKRSVIRRFRSQTVRTLGKALFQRNVPLESKNDILAQRLVAARKENERLNVLLSAMKSESLSASDASDSHNGV